MNTPHTFQLPDTFWRVSVKALIYDAHGRLLVFMDKNHEWEMPGGGWEHDETFEQCVKRELTEEAKLNVVSINGVAFCYRGKYKFRGDKVTTKDRYAKVSIAVRVTLGDSMAEPCGDDLIEARYVTREEFLQLAFQYGEASIQEYVDEIWP